MHDRTVAAGIGTDANNNNKDSSNNKKKKNNNYKTRHFVSTMVFSATRRLLPCDVPRLVRILYDLWFNLRRRVRRQEKGINLLRFILLFLFIFLFSTENRKT